MSTTGQFSTKNPTIKRILREAAELSTSPSSDYHAAPLEDNLFEWHFTLRGAPDSPFAGGIYHGRIVLPPAYPLRPPSFRFLTPSGRFEVNREICLSISGHHEETWQPAWGIRTALVAIRSFMDSDAGGQLGGMNAAENVRRKLAEESKSWKCPGCGGKSCDEIMKEQDHAVADAEGDEESQKAREQELVKTAKEIGMAAPAAAASSSQTKSPISEPAPAQSPPNISASATTNPPPPPPVTNAAPQPANPPPQAAPRYQPLAQAQPQAAEERDWVDKAIIGVTLMLVFMIGRKILRDYVF